MDVSLAHVPFGLDGSLGYRLSLRMESTFSVSASSITYLYNSDIVFFLGENSQKSLLSSISTFNSSTSRDT